jgi:hypothetical protein
MLKMGDLIELKEIVDQYGKTHKLKENQTLVITWDKETTAIANNYFDEKIAFFKNEDIAMIVDVSQTPEGIMNLFVMPRMRSYDHPILLSYDENFNLTLPYEDQKVTILKIRNMKVEEINFAEDENKLETSLLK